MCWNLASDTSCVFCQAEETFNHIRLRKLGCARIGCLFWLSEKSLNVEIAGGAMNLWLIMMDIGCAVYHDMV